MPILEFNIPEHEPYANSTEQLAGQPPTPAQDWTSADINLLRTVLANHGLYLGYLGEVTDLTTAAKNTLVASINSIISDASTTNNQAWSATKIIDYISNYSLNAQQVAGIDDAIAVVNSKTVQNLQTISQHSIAIDAVEITANTNQSNIALNLASSNSRFDGLSYTITEDKSILINAALIANAAVYRQAFDTSLTVLTATLDADIAVGQELIINRCSGANDLLVNAGGDITMPDGALADPLVLKGAGVVRMKKLATGWIVLELFRTVEA